MKFKISTFFVILSIFLFLGCNSKEQGTEKTIKSEEKVEKVKNNITSYKLKTLDNQEINIIFDKEKINIKEYPNKIILLNFFASWCPPCIAEIPSLIKLQKIYKKELVIISLILEKNKTNEELLKFKKEHNINFIISNSKDNFNLADKIGQVRNIPAMFILDKNRKIYQKYMGLTPFPMLKTDIEKIINK